MPRSSAARPLLPSPQSSGLELQQPHDQNGQLSALQEHVARLYGHGMKREQVAKGLLDHLCPQNGRRYSERVRYARNKLRKWERRQLFRDLVYTTAVQEVDVQLPLVLKGVTDKAKRGRVDAARLVLELTGRHNPKGEQAAPTVVIAIDGVPRPKQIGEAEVIDADAVER